MRDALSANPDLDGCNFAPMTYGDGLRFLLVPASETSPWPEQISIAGFSWAGDWQANDPKPRQRNYSPF